MVRQILTLQERLERRLVRVEESGCLEWSGYRDINGYGQIGRGKTEEGLDLTHRVAWEIANGERVPIGMVIRHACDNPPCCEPDHLSLGTYRDNTQDAVSRGRMARGSRLPHTKLTEGDVRQIRNDYILRFGPPKRGGRRSNAIELAERYGVTSGYIRNVVHGHERSDVA